MQSCAERLAAIKARKQAMKQEKQDVAKAEKKEKKFQASLTTKLAKYTEDRDRNRRESQATLMI